MHVFFFFFFFFNDTATTEIYTLSLHDALPIWRSNSAPIWRSMSFVLIPENRGAWEMLPTWFSGINTKRSEEHTSELQSHSDLVCRLLLEKKKKKNINNNPVYTNTKY